MDLDLLHALRSYAHVRSFQHRHRSRRSVEDWQNRCLARWIERHVGEVPAFSDRASRGARLADFPVMTKSDLMADFAAYNRVGLDAEGGWRAFEGSRTFGNHVVGASTGTSGNRGLFVVSRAERFRWLGAILAKGLPDFWRRRDRIAVLLPLDTPLYDTANKAGRMKLRFFDTSLPLEGIVDELVSFQPTVMIAPPRILRRLASADLALAPRALFSAAEKLEAFDRRIVEAAFKVRLREIYMATEGLLAVTCGQGRLHLSEDCMHFELEEADGELVSPIISDFSRTTQIMLRYRMNDLLRIDTRPCSCGSPLRVVSEVIGRMDDVFRLRTPGGRSIELTPDIIRNAVVDGHRSIDDFRVVQTGHESVELHLPASSSTVVRQAAVARLAPLFEQHGCTPHITLVTLEAKADPRHKLRRVENRTDPTRGRSTPRGSPL